MLLLTEHCILIIVLFYFCFICQFGNVKLPSEAFASSYEEPEGLLNLAAPTFGNLNLVSHYSSLLIMTVFLRSMFFCHVCVYY